MLTTLFTTSKQETDSKDKAFIFLNLIFAAAWIFFFRTATDAKDWWIENILVFLFIALLFTARRRFNFSVLSLCCIYLFLLLHIYGARMAYTHNDLGEWLRNRYQLVRNPYDRIVHFSFGFLLAYPFVELLRKKFEGKENFVLLLMNMSILCLATIFELLEWSVAALTDKVTGETYVATQGDPWDAQKDIVLALLGAALVAVFIKLYRRSFSRNMLLLMLFIVAFSSCKKLKYITGYHISGRLLESSSHPVPVSGHTLNLYQKQASGLLCSVEGFSINTATNTDGQFSFDYQPKKNEGLCSGYNNNKLYFSDNNNFSYSTINPLKDTMLGEIFFYKKIDLVVLKTDFLSALAINDSATLYLNDFAKKIYGPVSAGTIRRDSFPVIKFSRYNIQSDSYYGSAGIYNSMRHFQRSLQYPKGDELLSQIDLNYQ